MTDKYHIDTLAVRAGIHRSEFGEHSEAMYLTSSFVFNSAAQAAARFSGAEPGNVLLIRPLLRFKNASPHSKARKRASRPAPACRRYSPV